MATTYQRDSPEVAKLCLRLIAEIDARSVGDSHPSCYLCVLLVFCSVAFNEWMNEWMSMNTNVQSARLHNPQLHLADWLRRQCRHMRLSIYILSYSGSGRGRCIYNGYNFMACAGSFFRNGKRRRHSSSLETFYGIRFLQGKQFNRTSAVRQYVTAGLVQQGELNGWLGWASHLLVPFPLLHIKCTSHQRPVRCTNYHIICYRT